MDPFGSAVITTHFSEMAAIELNSIPCVFWEWRRLDGTTMNGEDGIWRGRCSCVATESVGRKQ